jgi:hypothetical protein
MTTKQQDKQPTAAVKQDHQEQAAAIGTRVLRALGQPPGLHQVQVRHLWTDHYRVNIFVGAEAGSAKVAHSYFLAADGEGNITACNPKITKQYGGAPEQE